jgi:hypothetical protein
MVGCAENSALLLFVTMKFGVAPVWPDEMLVAQAVTV